MNVPIYVKVDKYKELLGILKKVEAKLSRVDTMIAKINDLKTQEDKQIKQWNDNIDDIKDRLKSITEAFHQ